MPVKLPVYLCSECGKPMEKMPVLRQVGQEMPVPIAIFQCNTFSADPNKEPACLKYKFRLFVFDAPIKPLIITSHELRHQYPFTEYFALRLKAHAKKHRRRIAELKKTMAQTTRAPKTKKK